MPPEAPARWINICLRQNLCRHYSTPSQDLSIPPLLLKFKSDMKAAMKAKDTNRLNVLRGIIAETTNASKTASPFLTDIQLLSLLKKQAAAAKAAAQEFAGARRDDLKIKEEAQVAILEEYASEVETMGEDEMTAVIANVIGKMRTENVTVNAGTVLRAVIGAGGALYDKPVERAEVARIVRSIL